MLWVCPRKGSGSCAPGRGPPKRRAWSPDDVQSRHIPS